MGAINNATIIGIIEQKLPEEIETEWIKMITGNEKEPIQKDKFPYLLKLLVQFRERIEYKHASLRSSLNSRLREQLNFNVQDTIDDSNNRRVWCWLHPDSADHPIWRCEEFRMKSIEERLALVKTNRACFSWSCCKIL